MKPDIELQIVACVPVAYAPDLPKTSTYSSYEQVACPKCQQLMWLGRRSKALVNAAALAAFREGNVTMICLSCLIKEVGDAGYPLMAIPLKKLTDEDPEEPANRP